MPWVCVQARMHFGAQAASTRWLVSCLPLPSPRPIPTHTLPHTPPRRPHQIALEFHHMRDRWPSLFFTSQLGNKFW